MAAARRRDNDPGQKIRESCNSCSSQKIRCGKERPKCSRCAARGISCNYSLSQRTGRRGPSQSMAVPVVTSPPATGPESGTRFSPLAQNSGLSNNTFSIFDEPSAYDEADIFRDLNLNGANQLWTPDETLPDEGMVSMKEASTGFSGHAQTHNQEWQSMSAVAVTAVDSPFATCDSVVGTLVPFEHRPQDCLAIALQVVQDLHMPSEDCQNAATDSVTGGNANRDESRDVDTVLFRNREAVCKVQRVMECPCSADNSVSLACYMAVSKIIAWYGAEIGVPDSTRGDSEARSLLNKIIARPILMGSYCLDPEAERSVRAQVVLSELKQQVQPLLQPLPRFNVTPPPKGGNNDTKVSTPRPNETNCMLRDQLRAVVKEARNINRVDC